ncbi:s-layer family protein domain protein [Eubacterium sp. CAG:274]|nr:s-layer family protein domain protein [Eubacterium sp. CAG:274]
MKNETRVPISRITLRALAILAAAGSINVATIPLQEHFVYNTQASTRFSDDSSIRDYSRSSVESLLATGGIKGYPEDNTFRPQGTITKLEFLSMVVNSLDPNGTKLAEGVQQAKDDVEVGISYYDSLKKDGLLTEFWGGKAFDLIVGARELGIGSGYETNSTGGNWDTPITRQDAAMMVYQGLKALKGNDLYVTMGVAENRNGGKKLIGDWDELTDTDVPDGHPQSVSGCAHPDDILSLYEAGILQGDSEAKFYPNKYLTREDSAIIIDKAVNPEKRAKVTIPEADKEIDKTEGVENTTLKQTDPTRRGAIDGDTFIKADGTSIKVVRDEKSGVIGANQPVALDMGRELVRTSNEGKRIEHKIANYGEVKLSDGSLSVNLGYISNDKISADENTYSGKGDYYYNPKTGEGHSSTDWSKIAESLKPTGEGKPGDIKKVGLGDWCTYKYYDGVGWNCETVTGSDLTEAFKVDK